MIRILGALIATQSLWLVHCGGDDADTGSGTTTDKGLPTRSAGCGVAAAVSPADGTPAKSAAGRTYRYYVPTGYDASKAYPLVFVLHGTGATGAQMSQYIQMQEYVDGKAIVVFPDAKGGQWDLSGTTDLEFFDAMVADIGAATCSNPARVFVTGFSLGGYMTNYLGCHRGTTIRAIAPAASSFPGSSDACTPIPAFVYHKTTDDNEPVAGGKKARDIWKAIDGCSDSTEKYGSLECVSYDGCKSGTSLVWCEDTKVTPYNHDLDEAYRIPIWQWFSSLP